MRFRGREMAHQELGTKLLDRVKEDLAPLAKVEMDARFEGRQMIMILAPAIGAGPSSAVGFLEDFCDVFGALLRAPKCLRNWLNSRARLCHNPPARRPAG